MKRDTQFAESLRLCARLAGLLEFRRRCAMERVTCPTDGCTAELAAVNQTWSTAFDRWYEAQDLWLRLRRIVSLCDYSGMAAMPDDDETSTAMLEKRLSAALKRCHDLMWITAPSDD